MSSNKLTSRIASQYMANLEKKSFAEGPEGQKQFAEWFEDQPEDFQEEWKDNTEKYKDVVKDRAKALKAKTANDINEFDPTANLLGLHIYKIIKDAEPSYHWHEDNEDHTEFSGFNPFTKQALHISVSTENGKAIAMINGKMFQAPCLNSPESCAKLLAQSFLPMI
jgi:hypothetical protein